MIKKHTVLVVSHYTNTPGIGEKLISYFEKNFYDVGIIAHPLYPQTNLKSKIIIKHKTVQYKIPPLLQYILEPFSTIRRIRKHFKSKHFDVAICLDPLSFFDTFLLKHFMPIKKIVYYNVDYSPQRFNNPVMNFIYKRLNSFAFKNSDYFFYLAKRFVEDLDPEGKYRYKSFYLSHTTRIVRTPVDKRLKNSIIFAGTLTEGIDFKNLFQALEKIKKRGIRFVFDIYGDGVKKESVKKMIEKSTIKKFVNLQGIAPNDILTRKIFPQYRIGVAPFTLRKNYKSEKNIHLYIGDQLSTKIVEYIGAGLPVIVTPSYKIFKLIETHNFGFTVKTVEEWYKTLLFLLTKSDKYKRYSENAYAYAKNYDEKKVLDPIFKKIFSEK